jgi:hypothetical protein
MTTEKSREASPSFPEKHPNSIANLAPQKPGEQSINPRGRPKRPRNIRTIFDEMLHRYVDMKALKHLKGIDATVEFCERHCQVNDDLGKTGVASGTWRACWSQNVAVRGRSEGHRRSKCQPSPGFQARADDGQV